MIAMLGHNYIVSSHWPNNGKTLLYNHWKGTSFKVLKILFILFIHGNHHYYFLFWICVLFLMLFPINGTLLGQDSVCFFLVINTYMRFVEQFWSNYVLNTLYCSISTSLQEIWSMNTEMLTKFSSHVRIFLFYTTQLQIIY